MGYKLHWARVVDAGDFGGATRTRWLAVAYRTQDQNINPTPFMMWPSMKEMTVETIGAIFPEPPPDKHKLRVEPEMVKCATNKNMLPLELKRKYQDADDVTVLQARSYTKNDKLPIIMAKYGTQHRINPTSLEQKGFPR